MTNSELPETWGADIEDLTDDQRHTVADQFGDDAADDVVTVDMTKAAVLVVVNPDGRSMMRVRCDNMEAVDVLRQLADGLELETISGGYPKAGEHDG